jgi:hypothetical protein
VNRGSEQRKGGRIAASENSEPESPTKDVSGLLGMNTERVSHKRQSKILRVVRSVPLLLDGHSDTTNGARFLSRLNTVGDAVNIVLPCSTAGVVSVVEKSASNSCGRCIPSLLVASPLAEKGGLAPSITANQARVSMWATIIGVVLDTR